MDKAATLMRRLTRAPLSCRCLVAAAACALLLLFAAACSGGSAPYPTAGPDRVLRPIPEIRPEEARGTRYFTAVTPAEQECYRQVMGEDKFATVVAGRPVGLSAEQNRALDGCDTVLTMARLDLGRVIDRAGGIGAQSAACLNGLLTQIEDYGRRTGLDRPRTGDNPRTADFDFWFEATGTTPVACLTDAERAAVLADTG